jgi:hypothetical protein
MQRVVFCLGVVLCALLKGPAQPLAERHYFLPQGGSVFACVPGAAPTLVAHPGGFLAGLRTDLSGRWLARDILGTRLVLGDDSGVRVLPLPSMAADAVFLNAGRICAVLPSGSSGQLVFMDCTGGSRCAQPLTRLPLRVAACKAGVLLLVRDLTGGQHLEVRDLEQGSLRATRALPSAMRDLAFNDVGEILVPDVRGAIECLDQHTLLTRRVLPAPAGLREVLACGGQAYCGVLEPQQAVWIRQDCGVEAVLPVGSVLRLEALPDGGALVHELVSGMAHRVGRHGLSWFGAAPAALDFSDGSGLRHGRGVELEHDADGDGFATGVELQEATDPGCADSRPLSFTQAGALLHLQAPRHPSGIYWLHEDQGAAFPGFLAPPPLWVSSSVGTLDASGEGWLVLNGGTHMPASMRVTVVDPWSGTVLHSMLASPQSW